MLDLKDPESQDRRIRVLHMLQDGRVGGPGVRIVRIQEELNRHHNGAVEVVVASPPVKPKKHYDNTGIRHVEIRWHKPTVERPVRTGIRWLLAGIGRDVKSSREAIRRIRPSVVHVNGAILLGAVLAAHMERTPSVWHLNDIQVPRILAPLIRMMARFCKAKIIATSHSVIRHYGLPLATPVVYPPAPAVPMIDYGKWKEGGGKRMGVLANLAPIKRVEDAVEAFGLLRDRIPDLHLEIVGRILDTKFYYYERLKKRISILGLDDRVHFLGFVEDPVSWLQKIDLLIFPSESEAAGLAVIEAMACGTPVIAAEIPATVEIADEAAVIVPLGDAEAIASSVERLLNHKAEYDLYLRRGSRRSYQVFGVEKVSQKQYSIYKELTRASGNGRRTRDSHLIGSDLQEPLNLDRDRWPSGTGRGIRIDHVLSYVAARYGGPPEVAKKLGVAMSQHGISVSCWATGDSIDLEEMTSLDLTTHIFRTVWPRNWYRAPGLKRGLQQDIKRVDLVHLHELWTYPIYIGAKTARKASKPWVVTPHGIFAAPWRYRTAKKSLYRKLFAGGIVDGASCLHACSPHEVEGFRQAGYQGPIAVIPHGVDPAEFESLPDPAEAEARWPALEGKRVVYFLSRLSPEKGLDQLLTAWADITKKQSYSDCMLVMSGPIENRYIPKFNRLLETVGNRDRILLTGMVRGTDKKALISRADIFVLPSYSEGFSISLLENLAAGKPALITTACNFQEVDDVGAGLCVPPQRDSLAHGLRQLLDMTDSERAQMGLRGRDLVTNNYTWEIAARKLITVYDCILHGKEIPLFPQPMELDSDGKAPI